MGETEKLVAVKRKYEQLLGNQSVIETDLARMKLRIEKKYSVKGSKAARVRVKELYAKQKRLKKEKSSLHKELTTMMMRIGGH